MGGLRALATAALYLVLLSNGLPHPKIRLKKFGFSPESTSTNIAKKLPLQRCFKPLLIALFNFSHKRPTFAFTSESGYTLGSLRKIVHSGLHAETQGFTHAAVWSVQLSSRIWTEKSRRKRMHALRRVSASFGAAAPLGCVTLFVIWKCCCFVLCAQGILRVRGWGGITTLDVFRTQSKRPVPACPNDSFAVFRGRAAIIDSSAAKYVPFPAGTGLSHPNSPGSLLRKGTGAVFLHHFRERAKNVAICALVQVAFGSNLPPPTPVVMPFSTAHATACA